MRRPTTRAGRGGGVVVVLGGGSGSPLSRTMHGTRSPALPAALLAALLLVPLVAPALLPRSAAPALARHRRQLADDDALQPLEEAGTEEQAAGAREKRKLEGVTQAKFGIKNAVLGFVFGKINSLIDAKTRLVDSLDRQNIEINKQYGIEAPTSGGLASITGIVGQSGTTWRALARLRRQNSAPSLSTSPPGTASHSGRNGRQATTPRDDIPEFDRNKVSLDFPGNLFGPSVSLLIRTTKIIGDVIQNSAVRYQSFLRLFRPLFRGPFEIKGLDPPTTTTTTAASPRASDNEVRRRR